MHRRNKNEGFNEKNTGAGFGSAALLSCCIDAESEGSTPRTSGAYMLVGEKGLLYGTIGGGGMEYAWQRRAHSSVCAAVAAALSKRLTFLRQQVWRLRRQLSGAVCYLPVGKKRGIWQRKLLVQ